jgi:hypothetical protein
MIELFPMLSPNYLSLGDQQFQLSWVDGAVWMAVSACLECTNDTLETFQVAEKGRGILDNPEIDFSSDLARLENLHPHHYEQIQSMQNRLQHDESQQDGMDENIYNQCYRELTAHFNTLMSSIRTLDGFCNFLT